MSLPIWTPDALSSEAVRLDGKYWRMVEAQHRVSTLKVVDTLDEQALLEDLIEETKPQIPLECRHLHYLLATPFRYGSIYPYGSRFRRAGRTMGVYYAAETMHDGGGGDGLLPLAVLRRIARYALAARRRRIHRLCRSDRTDRAIDLTRPPLDRDAAAWTHPTDYAACQAIADVAREAGHGGDPLSLGT